MRYVAFSFLHLLPLPFLSSAITFDCKNVKADKVSWNFEKLGGMHEVSWIRPHANIVANTTFKIDICKALKLENEDERKHCGDGTRICAVEYHTDGEKNKEYVGSWAISREYVHDGAHMNPKLTRMKTEQPVDDKEPLEGVIVEIGGGVDNKREQKAIINFTCLPENEKEGRSLRTTEDDDKDSDNEKWEAAKKTDDGAGGSIQFASYDSEVLEIDWFSPYACEKAASSPDHSQDGADGANGKSGFFSWFFFLVFLLLIGFVLFTAWINYTRNGARGWDLLPFSDTLRDLPYILGDWSRKIASTLGGGATRGGYSAV